MIKLQAFCGKCSFEESGISDMSCGYEDYSTGVFKWENHQADTPSEGSYKPPDQDHTSSSPSGHYMLVDHSNNIYGESAVLRSPTLGATTELCTFRFWYHMQGDQQQELIIFNTVINDICNM